MDFSIFFFSGDRDDTIIQDSYRKTQKQRKIQGEPSGSWRLHPRAARAAGGTCRHSSTLTLDWEEPPCGKEVDDPQHQSASILLDDRRQLGQQQRRHRSLRKPDPPSRGIWRGEDALHNSSEPRARQERQIHHGAPPEHRGRRRGPPLAKASPATPPPPQRRRQAPYYDLDYVHTEIRRSPNLPPPEARNRTDLRRRAGQSGGANKSPFPVETGKGKRSKLKKNIFSPKYNERGCSKRPPRRE